jgi:hypothetical protein
MARRQFFGGEQREPAGPIPVVKRMRSDYANPPASGLRATWIGWSSVLVEIDGRIVLTDPVWSERCSPSTLVGPKRFHPPPIALDELPPVDVVIISHDHYDHLDMPAVQFLAGRGPTSPFRWESARTSSAGMFRRHRFTSSIGTRRFVWMISPSRRRRPVTTAVEIRCTQVRRSGHPGSSKVLVTESSSAETPVTQLHSRPLARSTVRSI